MREVWGLQINLNNMVISTGAKVRVRHDTHICTVTLTTNQHTHTHTIIKKRARLSQRERERERETFETTKTNQFRQSFTSRQSGEEGFYQQLYQRHTSSLTQSLIRLVPPSFLPFLYPSLPLFLPSTIPSDLCSLVYNRPGSPTGQEVVPCLVPVRSQSGREGVGQPSLEGGWVNPLRKAHLDTHTQIHCLYCGQWVRVTRTIIFELCK